jgi:hypothetical protein
LTHVICLFDLFADFNDGNNIKYQERDRHYQVDYDERRRYAKVEEVAQNSDQLQGDNECDDEHEEKHFELGQERINFHRGVR